MNDIFLSELALIPINQKQTITLTGVTVCTVNYAVGNTLHLEQTQKKPVQNQFLNQQ